MAEDAQSAKSLNNAADLAANQLERALQVARRAGLEADSIVVGALLEAIVVNYWKLMR
jgi:hypothetical protein